MPSIGQSRDGVWGAGARVFFVVLVVACVHGRSHALMVRSVGLDELTAAADRVFIGRCVESRDVAGGLGGLPVTETTFAVVQWLKPHVHASTSAGTASHGPHTGAARITVRQLARAPGLGSITRCAGGQEALLFLHPDAPSGLTSPVGLEQGVFAIVRRPVGGGPDLAVSEVGPHVFARRAGPSARRHGQTLPAQDPGPGGRAAVALDLLVVEILRLAGAPE